jgi:hypothetical protein
MPVALSGGARLSPVAAAVGLAVSLAVLFVICALVQTIAPGLTVTHAWIGLFTAAPTFSARAWIEGLPFSVVFGALTGAVFALAYNAALGRTA